MHTSLTHYALIVILREATTIHTTIDVTANAIDTASGCTV